MEQTVLDFGRDGIVLPHGPLEDDDWAENRLASRLVEHCRYFDAVSFLVDPIVYGKQGSHATSSRRDASDASDSAAIGKPKSKKASKLSSGDASDKKPESDGKPSIGRKRPHSEVAKSSTGGSDGDGEQGAAASSRSSGGSTYAELQERLRAKIEAMRSKRGGSKKNRKKEKGDNGKLSLAEAARYRKKQAKYTGGASKPSAAAAKAANGGPGSGSGKAIAGETSSQPASKKLRLDGSKRSKPTASADPADLGSLDFGELTAKRGGARGIDDEMRRRARQRRKSGDLGTLLERAKANQSKLAELQGTKEGAKMEHDQKWDAAARRAAGEKVKDDPKLLAKALKRKERSKAKSAEAWAERKATSDQQQAARQARREANLQRQIDHKKGIKAPKGKVGRKGGPAGAAAAGGKRPGSGSTKKGGLPSGGRRAGFEGKGATLNRGGK